MGTTCSNLDSGVAEIFEKFSQTQNVDAQRRVCYVFCGRASNNQVASLQAS
jgi:uncharacterized protein YuzB (UPF0349 family)